MIYTIDRETPDLHLQKATHEELDAIRDRVIALGTLAQHRINISIFLILLSKKNSYL